MIKIFSNLSKAVRTRNTSLNIKSLRLKFNMTSKFLEHELWLICQQILPENIASVYYSTLPCVGREFSSVLNVRLLAGSGLVKFYFL